ncbi:MAG: T9SS type A sorting domain-containing protein, partial [bacterium]
SRRDFLKASGIGTAAVTLAPKKLFINGNVNVSYQINDKDTGIGLENALIKMVHNSNPSINFEKNTDSNGYALIENVPTPVEHNPFVPTGYDLMQNFPNPFNPTTTLEFYTGKHGYADLTIFDELGRHVKTLVSKELPAGKHTLQWGGLDKFGRGTSAGMYFARLTAGDFTETIKLIKTDGGGTYVNEAKSTAQGEAPPGSHKVLSPDLYNITVEKANYKKIDKIEDIAQPRHFDWEMEKNDILKLYVIDNQTLEPTKGKVEINSQTFETDANGYLEVDVDTSTVDELKVYSTKNGVTNSFVQTYRNVPVGDLPAGLMVTTFSDLTDVDPSLAVTPELFREFMQEGNFIGGWPYSYPEGLKSIDFQNAQNPVPNPDGDHGYVYWIDRDFFNSRAPDSYGIFSAEEQLHIKDVIENYIMTKIRDATHMPQIYLAQPGETPSLEDNPGTSGQRLIPGTIFVTHQYGGNGYAFGWQDYDNDGIVDAATASIGDPTNLDLKIAEETGSIITPNPIYNPDMDGKTMFSERAGTNGLSPADLKALGIEENVNKGAEWAQYTLPNQVEVMRGFYKPLTHIDDILGIRLN